MTEAEMISLYISVRDRRAQRKKAFQEADADDEKIQDTIEARFLERFIKTGTNSISATGIGTVYTTTRTSATVADKEIFMKYVRERDEWPLLEVRAAKTAVEQYKDVHGELPPGINWREEVGVNIRRG